MQKSKNSQESGAATAFAAELEKMRDRLMVLLERLLRAYGDRDLPGRIDKQDVSDAERINAILAEAVKVQLKCTEKNK